MKKSSLKVIVFIAFILFIAFYSNILGFGGRDNKPLLNLKNLEWNFVSNNNNKNFKISRKLDESSLELIDKTKYGYYREPSQDPPKGLKAKAIPQFIVFGFDDNYDVKGMEAIIRLFKNYKNPKGNNNTLTFDEINIRATFYNTVKFVDLNNELKNTWKKAYLEGFEIGNHTYSHQNGSGKNYKEYNDEIIKSEEILKSFLGEDFKSSGFRAPFLSYNQEGLQAIKDFGFEYDCSIPEGDQDGVDGSKCYWPYTLDNGSPCNEYANIYWNDPLVTGVKGLWEIPAYSHTVPDDNKCEKYGIEKGLRNRMYKASKDFDIETGKVSGMEWNVIDKFKASKKEYTAILKYSLDLRMNGNKSPLTVGVHSNYYSDMSYYNALKEFIEYALEKEDVRIVTAKQLLKWLENPVTMENK
ncbi:MAG: polysaccharide deacetylase family protein [Clostridiales bacterium]